MIGKKMMQALVTEVMGYARSRLEKDGYSKEQKMEFFEELSTEAGAEQMGLEDELIDAE